MNKLFTPLFFLSSLFFFSCSSDETTVQIVRAPVLKFDFSPSNSWTASRYSINNTSQVVVYPQDPGQPAQLYDRYTLEGAGKDDSGQTYQIILTFDVSDTSQLVGIYSPSYNTQRGLAQVQLFNLTNKNDLSVYNLCGDNLANDIFQIQKEKQDEKIITGVFQMTLCDSRDSTKKLNIINGSMKDLKY